MIGIAPARPRRRPGPSAFLGLTWPYSHKIIPCIFREQCFRAAFRGLRLHEGSSRRLREAAGQGMKYKLNSVPPAGFEPAAPALGERCSIP